MAEPQLSPISCKRCRVRKIRCNRLLPACNMCEERRAECIYSQRKPRKSVRTYVDRVASMEIALSRIQQRLERIEQNCHCHNIHEAIVTPSNVGFNPRNASQPGSENHLNYMHNSVELDALSSNIVQNFSSSPSLTSSCRQPLWAGSGSGTLTSGIRHATVDVQRVVGICGHCDSRTEDVFHIQPELAKSWIRSYFTNLSEDLLPEFFNVQLIELMPDIIGTRNTHLDASLIVVYYCILYQGCFLHRQYTPFADCASTMGKLYYQCLQAVSDWELHSAGSLTDFIAAFLMVRVAAERFDIDLSWKMFKRACRCAQIINLHHLDNGDSPALAGQSKTVLDAGRKGFWELLSMDLYFWLIHNMPPVVIPGWRDAKVDLPWLAETGLQSRADITTARFLIDTRRTFVLMEFFQLLEDAKARPDPELVPKTEALCESIEALYQDWEIDKWVRKMIDSGGQLWTIAGVALEGYTCILFMLSRVINADLNRPQARALNPDIIRFPLALKASRYILEIVALLLTAIPYVGTISVTFVVFQARVPYACLATNLLHSVTPHDYEADANLLERVACGIRMIPSNAMEVASLTTVVESLNAQVRYRLHNNGPK